MMAALITVLIQGFLPINEDNPSTVSLPHVYVAYALSNAASMVFLFLSIILYIEIVTRVSKFNVERSKSYRIFLATALKETSHLLDTIRPGPTPNNNTSISPFPTPNNNNSNSPFPTPNNNSISLFPTQSVDSIHATSNNMNVPSIYTTNKEEIKHEHKYDDTYIYSNNANNNNNTNSSSNIPFNNSSNNYNNDSIYIYNEPPSNIEHYQTSVESKISATLNNINNVSPTLPATINTNIANNINSINNINNNNGNMHRNMINSADYFIGDESPITPYTPITPTYDHHIINNNRKITKPFLSSISQLYTRSNDNKSNNMAITNNNNNNNNSRLKNKNTTTYTTHTNTFPYSYTNNNHVYNTSGIRLRKNLASLSNNEIDIEFRSHESKILHTFMEQRDFINDVTAKMFSDERSFDYYWNNYCKSIDFWGQIFFYIGTACM